MDNIYWSGHIYNSIRDMNKVINKVKKYGLHNPVPDEVRAEYRNSIVKAQLEALASLTRPIVKVDLNDYYCMNQEFFNNDISDDVKKFYLEGYIKAYKKSAKAHLQK